MLEITVIIIVLLIAARDLGLLVRNKSHAVLQLDLSILFDNIGEFMNILWASHSLLYQSVIRRAFLPPYLMLGRLPI